MINLLEEDGIDDAVVMVVVLADAVLVGVDVVVLFVSSKR